MKCLMWRDMTSHEILERGPLGADRVKGISGVHGITRWKGHTC